MRASGRFTTGPDPDRFVGRSKELADLTGDLDNLPHPRGPVRVLRGAAGVGKTRLAEELSRLVASDDVAVAWGRSPEELTAPPYWPWVQVVRSLLGRTRGTDLAEMVLEDPSPVERFELFDATAAAIRSASSERRVLVVIDDLHAADPDTLQLARFLARQLSDARVLIVATERTGASVDDGTRHHIDALSRLGYVRELAGLDVDVVADLLGDREHAVAVHAVTGGNPLHVHETARALTHLSDVAVPTTSVELEAALSLTVSQRIDSLDAESRSVLNAASVLGAEIDRRELAVMVEPLDPVTMDSVLSRLDDGGFLSNTDPVRFRHPLPARILQTRIPVSELQALHRRAAELIGTDSSRAGEIAHHLLRAGPDHRHDAIDASRRAGELATAAAAHEVAVALLTRAADAVDAETDGPLNLEVLLDLGAALWRAGRTAEADRAYERAWVQAVVLGDADSLARAVLRNGVEYYFADNARPGIVPRVETALAAQPVTARATTARLLAELSTHHLGATVERGRELADSALEMARSVDDPLALGSALIARQVADLGPATMVQRIADAHEILTCAHDADDYRLAVHGRFLLMGALLEAGDIGGVDSELLRYDGFAEDLGEPRFNRFSLWLRATRAMLDGDVAAAEALAEETFKISQELGDPDAFGVYGGQIGVLYWMQGRLIEMEPVYTDLRASEPNEPLWPSALAWIAATHGQVETARGALAAVPDPATLPSGMHWLLTATTYAETAALVGTDEQVDAGWNALVPYAERMVPIAMGAAVWGTVAKSLGHLALRRGDIDDGIAYLRTAVRTCARLGARPWMIDAQLDLADALALHRSTDPDIDVLRSEASATARRLGLDLFVKRVDALAATPGEKITGAVQVDVEDEAIPGRPRVRVIGGFEVVGATGSTARWTSRKARELLKILVTRRGAPISRESLMDFLWPGEDPDLLGNRLSVALSTVRRSLDPERVVAANDLITTTFDAVALNLDTVDVDVEHLLDGARDVLAQERFAASEPSTGAVEQATELLDRYRGEALPDEPHAEWATALRGEVRMVMTALARLAAADAVRTSDHLRAVEAHRRILDIDPYDEAANRGLIAAFRAMGAHGQGEVACGDYRARMAELGIEVADGCPDDPALVAAI